MKMKKHSKEVKDLFKIEGVGIIHRDDFIEYVEDKFGDINGLRKALLTIRKITTEPRGNIAKQLKELKQAAKVVADGYLYEQELLNSVIKENERLTQCVDRGRKRWSKEEDEYLIEMVTRDSFNPENGFIELAGMFGRTPGAIQSRITYLVGIKRISQNVAGRFEGKINGEEMSGYIDGVLSL